MMPYKIDIDKILALFPPIKLKKPIMAPSRIPHPASETGINVSNTTGGTITLIVSRSYSRPTLWPTR